MAASRITSVSYTHLDVYKRQDERYTVSRVTGDEFDTDVKRLAAPGGMGGAD